MIEDGIYRGAHPSLKNMRFMRRLNLHTILSLVPDSTGPPRDLSEYCSTERIQHIWHHVDKYNETISHTPQLVACILSQLIDPRNHPLFLHCRDGGHNTGLVVMCLRRLQNWSLPLIYQEFKRYTKSNEISYVERQFVESFRETVTIPVCIPRWLWDGVRHRRHPSILLRLERDPGTPTSLQSPNPSVGRDLDHAQTSGGLMPIIVPFREFHQVGYHRIRCKHVKMRYTCELAALDLHGVYFLKYKNPPLRPS